MVSIILVSAITVYSIIQFFEFGKIISINKYEEPYMNLDQLREEYLTFHYAETFLDSGIFPLKFGLETNKEVILHKIGEEFSNNNL